MAGLSRRLHATSGICTNSKLELVKQTENSSAITRVMAGPGRTQPVSSTAARIFSPTLATRSTRPFHISKNIKRISINLTT